MATANALRSFGRIGSQASDPNHKLERFIAHGGLARTPIDRLALAASEELCHAASAHMAQGTINGA